MLRNNNTILHRTIKIMAIKCLGTLKLFTKPILNIIGGRPQIISNRLIIEQIGINNLKCISIL